MLFAKARPPCLSYPERPFFTILMDAAKSGEITVYSAEDDKFSNKMSIEEVSSIGSSVDTVTTFDPETYEEQIQIVSNDLNPEDVKGQTFTEADCDIFDCVVCVHGQIACTMEVQIHDRMFRKKG